MANIDEQLDRSLREPDPAIGDDGFTERVMARLPYRAPERTLPGRSIVVAVAAVAGSLATLVLAPPIQSAFGLLALPGGVQTLIFTVIGFVAVVALPLGWLFGASIIAALRRAGVGLGL